MQNQLLVIFILLASLGCQAPDSTKDKENLLLGALVYELTRTPYVERSPTSGSLTLTLPAPTGTKTFNFNPSCSGTAGNETFKFYTKKGTSRNYIINFMGGGACWDAKNCLGTNTPTYFNQASQFSSLAAKFAFNGILDETNPMNPYRDWNVIFIPYCTGDLHWGSNDTTYNDPNTGVATTFKHRGFQNFISVLDFMLKDSEFKPDSSSNILVTGQSAGGYGAIFNFPYVKEVFTSSTVSVISDASNGVVPTGFANAAATNRWKADSNVPEWLTGFNLTNFQNGNLTLGNFFKLVADTYSTSRVGQYTTAFDGNQRFFYNVQKLILGTSPYTSAITYEDRKDLWGSSTGVNVPLSISCDWVTQARSEMVTKSLPATNSNYKYYRASGDVHTVSTSVGFYTVSSGGRSVLDWYQDITNRTATWNSWDCLNTTAGCVPPASAICQ